MSDYTILKFVHVSCVLLSLTGFLLRSYFLLLSPGMLVRWWVKYTPHFVETTLLISALAMLPLIDEYPFSDNWLTAKLLAMLCYIAVAGYTLHGAKKMITKFSLIMLSLIIFSYIIGVAIYHNPFFWTVR